MQIQISLRDHAHADMWRQVWQHVRPPNWDHMHAWLWHNYKCKVQTVGIGMFCLKFTTAEAHAAFVLAWCT
jgi:hypothetical protein